ncbi:hypothetical protein FE257_005362 [Aspergillus nanangensis]|uniref:Protein kinase domain-containing protein n=1 Tax=Aspergillus nanangensis TaxID=2582783 RepID=A0AAD4CSA4_ASPNN|nr:hypothetical protein FE257_005362 [Aspergillus nanangensis]
MNTIRPSIPRLSALLRKKLFSMPSPKPPLPPGKLIDEEISPVYNSKYFYPAKPGEVLENRYHTMVKVGWGVSSTIEQHISTANQSHRGRALIRTLLDSFEVKDLKLENIMVSFEDPTVLADFMDSQLEKPISFKIDSTRRPVYQSRNDFGPLKSLESIPQLVDFGLATRLEEDDDWGVWPIQPDHYQAPEVILGDEAVKEAEPRDLGVESILPWNNDVQQCSSLEDQSNHEVQQ